MEEGIYPRFDVVKHDIVDPNGNPTGMPDLSPYADYQFILYDTLSLRSRHPYASDGQRKRSSLPAMTITGSKIILAEIKH
jgi:hypothetical protein